MRIVKLTALLISFSFLMILTGCVAEQDYKDLRVQNNTQRKRIAKLESDVQTSKLKLDQSKRELEATGSQSTIEIDALQQQVVLLEKGLMDKRQLISSMQHQLLYGGASLPVELSTMLEDFANGEEMVTYDPNNGIVKFKSDLLFKSGSDDVLSSANNAVKSLCKILNSDQGKNFDIIVAGHTDDQVIRYSRAKHPSNWHLSSHRAISVLTLMGSCNVSPGRMSVRGFGEYRPITPNKSKNKGNKMNRRVEIYIVPKGV
ncbi:MAG: OmpA family protein [Planctomycetes bacterium]|nr:OmpA family protein [Planctomycetota bacterium]